MIPTTADIRTLPDHLEPLRFQVIYGFANSEAGAIVFGLEDNVVRKQFSRLWSADATQSFSFTAWLINARLRLGRKLARAHPMPTRKPSASSLQLIPVETIGAKIF